MWREARQEQGFELVHASQVYVLFADGPLLLELEHVEELGMHVAVLLSILFLEPVEERLALSPMRQTQLCISLPGVRAAEEAAAHSWGLHLEVIRLLYSDIAILPPVVLQQQVDQVKHLDNLLICLLCKLLFEKVGEELCVLPIWGHLRTSFDYALFSLFPLGINILLI